LRVVVRTEPPAGVICRAQIGSILKYLAQQIEDDKRRGVSAAGRPVMTRDFWQGSEAAHEDTARFIEESFSLSRSDFFR